MNAKENIQKLKKTARVSLKIIGGVLIVVMAAALGLAVLTVWTAIGAEVPAGFVSAIGALQLPVTGVTLYQTSLILLLLEVKCVIYLAALFSARQIVRDIAQRETPFEQVQVRRMKRIAILIFAGSAINFMSFQIGEWVIALVLWLLAMVFDYGCVLQQESDETL